MWTLVTVGVVVLVILAVVIGLVEDGRARAAAWDRVAASRRIIAESRRELEERAAEQDAREAELAVREAAVERRERQQPGSADR